MGGTRSSLGLSVAVLLTAASARADEVAWRLEAATARYDLTVDARPAPEPSPAPTFLPLVLLQQDDLDDARVPKRATEDLGDVVWRYVLALPAGDVGAKAAAEAPFDERLSLTQPVAVTLRCKGAHQSRLRGKKAAIRTQLSLSAVASPSMGPKDGTLTVEKTFDLKTGRLEAATWTLELEVITPAPQGGMPGTLKGTWTGRVTPGDGIGGDARELHARVQDAIKRGVAWLTAEANKRIQATRPGTSQGLGSVALLTFALLRSGVAPAEVEHHFEWMRRQPWTETYSVSLYIMALEARSVTRVPVPPQARLRSVVRYQRNPVPARDKEEMALATKWLLAARKAKEGWWSYGGRTAEPGKRDAVDPTSGPTDHGGAAAATAGDRSNSQFAILALHSAVAAGVEVPGEVWEELLKELVESQEETGPEVPLAGTEYAGTSPLSFDPRDEAIEGSTTERARGGLPSNERASGKARGWTYGMVRRASGADAYGSMSAAGLSSLVIVREGLEATRRLTPQRDHDTLWAIRDGVSWFAKNFDAARNVNRGTAWWYYYLYSVEKAMDLAGVERVGEHEWWREGVQELLARQQPNGAWVNDPNETALALLFLNRATLPARLEVGKVERVATGAADPSAWDKVILPGNVGQVALRQVLLALGQATSSAEVKDRLELAQQGMSAFDQDARPRLVPELQALLESPHRSVKKWARDQVLLLAGTEDAAALRSFADRWEQLRRAGEGQDLAAIPQVQAVLLDPQATMPLKRAALRTVGRLRAVETTGEIIALLEHKELALRQAAWEQLQPHTGPGREFDPAAAEGARKKAVDAWRGWWREEGPKRVAGERARRLAVDLQTDAKATAAAKELEAIGKPAVRALIDALRVTASKARAHALLKKITGEAFPADLEPWLAWWEKQPG